MVLGQDLNTVEALADMVIICPPVTARGPAAEIRARGNCPLEIGNAFLAEIAMGDVKASWQSACKLQPRKVSRLTRLLGQNLAAAELGEELDRKLGEATAFFLLALRHHRLSAERAMHRGAAVTWHAETGLEEVEYLT